MPGVAPRLAAGTAGGRVPFNNFPSEKKNIFPFSCHRDGTPGQGTPYI